MINHEIDPVFDRDSRILILGSFPSVKSRKEGFFYGNPQNRFWKILSGVLDQKTPGTVDEKKRFLLDNHIAVWDVIASCTISGSSDSTIKDVVPTDLSRILDTADIRMIFTNGGKATSLYKKYQRKSTGIESVSLPSSSPANASWRLERLIDAWKTIKAPLLD